MKTTLFGYLRKNTLPALIQTKNYARIVGVILFLIGLLGFAFRTDNSLPDIYLGGALILGFWGIVSGLWDNPSDTKNSENQNSSGDR